MSSGTFGTLGEHLEIGSDNGNKASKTGEQWKYEPWDPQDWWHRPKLGFWKKKEEEDIPQDHSHCEFHQVTWLN